MTAYPSLQWSADSHAGPRIKSEDYVVFTQSSDTTDIIRKGVLLVVCDGSASTTGGAQAARLAAHRVIELYYDDSASAHPQFLLAKAVRDAWRHVREQSQAQHAEMQTAICACAVFEDIAYVAQMGEIRAYTLRDGKFKSLNEAVQNQQSIEQPLQYSSDTLIQARYALKPGDRIVLCSDGIYNALNNDRLRGVLCRNRLPEQAVNALIKAAIDKNLQNNASVAVLNFNRNQVGRATAMVLGHKSIWQRVGILSAVSVPIVLIGLLVFSLNDFEALVKASIKYLLASSTPISTTSSLKPTNVLKPNLTATLIPTVSSEPQQIETPRPTPIAIQAIITEISTQIPGAPRRAFIVVLPGMTANIRRSANARTRAIGLLRAGQSAELVGRSADSQWWQIQAGLQRGWISAEFVSINGDANAIPVK